MFSYFMEINKTSLHFTIEQQNKKMKDTKGYNASSDQMEWHGGSVFATQQERPQF